MTYTGQFWIYPINIFPWIHMFFCTFIWKQKDFFIEIFYFEGLLIVFRLNGKRNILIDCVIIFFSGRIYFLETNFHLLDKFMRLLVFFVELIQPIQLKSDLLCQIKGSFVLQVVEKRIGIMVEK